MRVDSRYYILAPGGTCWRHNCTFCVSYPGRFRKVLLSPVSKVASLLHRIRFQAHKIRNPHLPDDWLFVDILGFSGAIRFLARKNL